MDDLDDLFNTPHRIIVDDSTNNNTHLPNDSQLEQYTQSFQGISGSEAGFIGVPVLIGFFKQNFPLQVQALKTIKFIYLRVVHPPENTFPPLNELQFKKIHHLFSLIVEDNEFLNSWENIYDEQWFSDDNNWIVSKFKKQSNSSKPSKASHSLFAGFTSKPAPTIDTTGINMNVVNKEPKNDVKKAVTKVDNQIHFNDHTTELDDKHKDTPIVGGNVQNHIRTSSSSSLDSVKGLEYNKISLNSPYEQNVMVHDSTGESLRIIRQSKEIKHLQEQLTMLRNQNSKLTTEIDEYNQYSTTLSYKVQGLENSLIEEQNKNENLSVELQNAKQEYFKMNEKRLELMLEVNEKKTENGQIEGQLVVYQRFLNELEQSIINQREQLTEMIHKKKDMEIQVVNHDESFKMIKQQHYNDLEAFNQLIIGHETLISNLIGQDNILEDIKEFENTATSSLTEQKKNLEHLKKNQNELKGAFSYLQDSLSTKIKKQKEIVQDMINISGDVESKHITLVDQYNQQTLRLTGAVEKLKRIESLNSQNLLIKNPGVGVDLSEFYAAAAAQSPKGMKVDDDDEEEEDVQTHVKPKNNATINIINELSWKTPGDINISQVTTETEAEFDNDLGSLVVQCDTELNSITELTDSLNSGISSGISSTNEDNQDQPDEIHCVRGANNGILYNLQSNNDLPREKDDVNGKMSKSGKKDLEQGIPVDREEFDDPFEALNDNSITQAQTESMDIEDATQMTESSFESPNKLDPFFDEFNTASTTPMTSSSADNTASNDGDAFSFFKEEEQAKLKEDENFDHVERTKNDEIDENGIDFFGTENSNTVTNVEVDLTIAEHKSVTLEVENKNNTEEVEDNFFASDIVETKLVENESILTKESISENIDGNFDFFGVETNANEPAITKPLSNANTGTRTGTGTGDSFFDENIETERITESVDNDMFFNTSEVNTQSKMDNKDDSAFEEDMFFETPSSSANQKGNEDTVETDFFSINEAEQKENNKKNQIKDKINKNQPEMNDFFEEDIQKNDQNEDFEFDQEDNDHNNESESVNATFNFY
eukprot:TRINITY_DN2073_c0_g2_i1.p1 TRINITY_DN2073_c0_g2~~TRINITY_DN2073_c0_g2_i1.p1  ORF type:complete len:1074 (+),score=381.34 TRINITY_DN2073_c0_g2_i1:62-3223(+)